MATRPLDRLLFAQGGLCFFCGETLPLADASVEHLVASANGGSNGDENCVACCKTLNRLLGRMSLKEKLSVILNQKGDFRCPNGRSTRVVSCTVPSEAGDDERLAAVVANLRSRGAALPRTVRTLSSTVSAIFQKQLAEADIARLIDTLKACGIIQIVDQQVSYQLPGD